MKKSTEKFLIAILTFATIFSFSVGSIFALTKAASTSAQLQQTRMDNLKSRADNEIARRIAALNDLINRINAMKHVKDSDKTSFISAINTEIYSLRNLKTKIDADTDVTTLKADVQSIITDYRVFLVFIPQIRILAASDRVKDVADKLSDLSLKLQTRINSAKSSGNDVTSLENYLTDMTKKIADANTQFTNIQSTIIPLTPSGYPANKSTLLEGRKMIQTARLDLVTALQDAQKIIQGLKTFSKTATSSASQ